MSDVIPKDYHMITPYLVIKEASQAIEFYQGYEPQGKPWTPDSEASRWVFNRLVPEGDKKVFGAEEIFRMENLNDKAAQRRAYEIGAFNLKISL